MEINRKHFPKIMQDNDEVFLAHLEGVISSVDELCSLEITNKIDKIKSEIKGINKIKTIKKKKRLALRQSV